MSNIIKLSILSMVALLALLVPSSPIEQGVSTTEEYEVFSALVNDLFAKDNVKLVVITNPTCCDKPNMDPQSESWKMYLEYLGPVSNETLEDYVARNRQPIALETKFKLKTNYQIVPYEGVEKLFSNVDLDDAWKTFYSKYPASGGYIRLSRIGFNKTKDQAMVSTAWMCNTLCGEGNYVVLTKQDGSWKVLKKVVTWVS